MDNRKNKSSNKSESGRVWAGLIILIFGIILLAEQLNLNFHIPTWIISWPMVLIVVGIVIGGTSNFKNASSYVLIALGVFFIMQREFSFNVWRVFFPLLIIGLGAWLLVDRKNARLGGRRQRVRRTMAQESTEQADIPEDWDKRMDGGSEDTRAEFVSSTAIFSEVKKQVFSKNFKGGDIVNVFGGTDINLIQADVNGPVVIDVFQLFAGTKIIVPAHWTVISEVVSVFGEVDDRRFVYSGSKDQRKTVYLKGTSIFGGITIKSM